METMTKAYIEMSQQECCHETCGIVYWTPRSWEQNRRNDHRTFYCPNGHAQVYYAKSAVEKVRDELTREKHRREQADAEVLDLNGRLRDQRRRTSAAHGQVTKIKNRVAKGV